MLERLVGGKLCPVRPAEFGSGKDGRELSCRGVGGALGVLLALVEAFEEEQEGKLLDGVEGIGQPAGPELVPESFDGERSVVSVSMSLGGERLGELEKVADFLRGEEAFDRVTAEVGQRRVVEVGLDQRALCQEDLLNGPKKAYLLGIVVVGRMCRSKPRCTTGS